MATSLKNSLVIAILATLIGCSSNPSALELSKRSHQKRIIKANAGDYQSIRTLQRDTCNGNVVYVHYPETVRHVLFKNAWECEKWSIKLLEAHRQGRESKEQWQEVAFYSDLLSSPQHLDYDWARKAVINTLITEVEKVNSLSSQLGLFDFLSKNSAFDPKGKKRIQLSKALCPKTSKSKICSYYANKLYHQDKDEQALKLFEKYGAYSSYDKRALAWLYINPPKGYVRKPEKAIELLKAAYDGPYGLVTSCHKKNRKSDKKCIKLVKQRDRKLAEAKREKTFLDDKQLPASVREDKYKLVLTKHLKAKNYALALDYFEFLDRLEYVLPDGMFFHRAESFFHTQKNEAAKSYYLKYINKTGKSGTYYRKSLLRLNEL